MTSFSKRTNCLLLLFVFIFSVVFSGLVGGGSAWWVYNKMPNKSGISSAIPFAGSEVYKVEEDSAVVKAVEKVSPAVVSITLKKNVQDMFGSLYQQEGGGTGFIINSDGLIVTNKHVVSDENTEYTVLTSDGKNFEAKVKSIDSINDLAVIKIEATGLPVVDLGDSSELKMGQKVIAIGNALNEYNNTVTTGVISAVDRTIIAGDSVGGASEQLENMIQTDAAINPGNSGGPLVDVSGRVVGINTAIDIQASGIGFAIPINQVKSAIESVLKYGKIVRPRIGVRYIPITPEFAALNEMDIKEGALVYSGSAGELAVIPGGPADKAGVQINDIIVSINTDKIDQNHSLSSLLQKYKAGDEIELEFWRKGEKKMVKVMLDEMK